MKQTYQCKYCGKVFNPYLLDDKLHIQHCHNIVCMKKHAQEYTRIKGRRSSTEAPTIPTIKEVTTLCRVCKKPFLPKQGQGDICSSPSCKRKEKQKTTDRIYNLLYPRSLEDYFDEPKKTTTRECLKCERLFESDGNWLCPRCSESNRQIMEW